MPCQLTIGLHSLLTSFQHSCAANTRTAWGSCSWCTVLVVLAVLSQVHMHMMLFVLQGQEHHQQAAHQ